MKLSAMTCAFLPCFRDRTARMGDFVRFCADLGLDAIEIIQSQEVGLERELDAALTETGLAVCSYVSVVDLLCPDRDQQARNQDEFQRHLDRAVALGVPYVMYFPAVAGRFEPSEERKRFIETCNLAAERAGRAGVTLTVENVGAGKGTALHGRLAHMQEIAAGVDSPHFRLAFDTGNFVMVGEDPAEAIGPLAAHVAHVHVKDVVAAGGGFEETTIGQGLVRFGPIFAALRACGYEGYLSLECYLEGTRADKEAMVSASAARTRELWAQAG